MRKVSLIRSLTLLAAVSYGAGPTCGTANAQDPPTVPLDNGRFIVKNTTVVTTTRCVGWLYVIWPNGTVGTATGTLVSRNHVLTAAHNLYDRSRGGWAGAVLFSPGYNHPSNPYGVASANAYRVPQAYINAFGSWTDDPKYYDIGIIRLNKPLGDRAGWMSLGNNFPESTQMRASGYDGPDGIQVIRGGIVKTHYEGLTLSSVRFLSSFDAYPGASGGPVWYRPGPGQRGRIIGVMADTRGVYGAVCVKTSSQFDLLTHFMRTYP